MNAFFSISVTHFETFWKFVEWLVAVFVRQWQLIFSDVDGYRSIINMYIVRLDFGDGFSLLYGYSQSCGCWGFNLFTHLTYSSIVRYSGKNFERTKLVAEIQRLNKIIFDSRKE